MGGGWGGGRERCKSLLFAHWPAFRRAVAAVGSEPGRNLVGTRMRRPRSAHSTASLPWRPCWPLPVLAGPCQPLPALAGVLPCLAGVLPCPRTSVSVSALHKDQRSALGAPGGPEGLRRYTDQECRFTVLPWSFGPRGKGKGKLNYPRHLRGRP